MKLAPHLERTLAFHESAHAVISLIAGVPVRRVTIEPDSTSDGHSRPAIAVKYIDVTPWMRVLSAGAAAERKLTGQPATLDSHDVQQLRLHLSAFKTDNTATAELDRLAVLADAEVTLHWLWIARVAERLIRKRSLTGAEVAELMDGCRC